MTTYDYIRETLDPETNDIVDVEFFDGADDLRSAMEEAWGSSTRYDFAVVRDDRHGQRSWMYLTSRALPSSVIAPETDFRCRVVDPAGWVMRDARGGVVCVCPAKIIAQLRRI